MKKKLYLSAATVLILSILFLISFKNSNGDPNYVLPKYIGMEKCAGICHKGDLKGRQYEIWESSKHSMAYKDLLTPAADSIAKSRGFQTSAASTPACIKCHVLGKDINPDEMEPTFDKTQGVQCETCHGAGSEYRMLLIMKDKQKAFYNGLIIPENPDAFCKTCHNEESPTYKIFDYIIFWDRIKHPDPNIMK